MGPLSKRCANSMAASQSCQTARLTDQIAIAWRSGSIFSNLRPGRTWNGPMAHYRYGPVRSFILLGAPAFFGGAQTAATPTLFARRHAGGRIWVGGRQMRPPANNEPLRGFGWQATL
jgi:hypothetical protein